jgi:hypothetical protein
MNVVFFVQNTSRSAEFIEYTIPVGSHYASGNTYKEIHQPDLRFQVLFDSSAIYKTRRGDNQYDINKLYGFSDCGTMHHENSARFGWRWNGQSIEIHAYWYNDSTRHNEFLDTISPGSITELALKVLPRQYEFEIKDRLHVFPRHCGSTSIQGYRLYPYFGGDEAAPHDIRIKIKEL